MAPEAQTTPCPHCGKTYSSNTRICPDDGSVIEHSSPLVGQVGAVLDSKYRLDAFLSHGGMGAVYRATHVMLGKTIAVKLINPELVTSPEIVRRFQREARAATSLNHPNIVAVYDLGQTPDGTLYIAMEFVDGPSLKDAIERGSGMAPARAIELLRQVAAALSRAHRQGIVHRDLKPHNIMLAQGDDGRELVKLVDFGIAKTFDEGTKLTSTGLPIGTPHYMAPEQASGAAVDARSDLYSVGVILFEMLTGAVPFDGEFTPAILFKHISEPPVAPSVKKPGVVPRELDEIVLRLLQKNPADRYQSADELADALDDAALSNPALDPAQLMPRTGTRSPAVRNTPVQVAASTAGPTGAPTRTPAPKAPAPAIQATPTQRAPGTAVGPTVVMPKPTPAPPPAAAAAARVDSPVAPSPPQAATLPPAAAVPATPKSSSSSAVVLIGFLVAGIIATVGAAYYFNGRGSPVSTEVATNSATATSSPATESPAKAAAEASTPTPVPPSATLPASSPSVPADAPANPSAATQGAAPAVRPVEPASNPAPPAAAGNARVNQPPAGNPPSPKATTSPPQPPARASAPSSQGQPVSQPARGSGQPPAAAPAASAAAAAAQVPAAAPQAPPAGVRREVPAAQAAPATFPEKPAVFFRCTGPTEVCNPLRTAVDEALGGAGLTIVRRPTGADIDVEAQVEVLQQNVDRQFGTTFAVRTYSIVLNGETTKTGEVVSMPSVENLSFDQRVGSERANERARLVAAGVVERVKAFAAKKAR